MTFPTYGPATRHAFLFPRLLVCLVLCYIRLALYIDIHNGFLFLLMVINKVSYVIEKVGETELKQTVVCKN